MNKKEKILRAAVQVFAKKGFKATTTREICNIADCNINSISYYFGGKDALYKAVLAFMFEETEKFQPQIEPEIIERMTPEQWLKTFILTFCKVMFGIKEEIDEYFAVLFVQELANPSPYLDEMVAKYIAPGNREKLDILTLIMGEDVPFEAIMDTGCSIMGQIMYYSFAWPLFIRLNPDHPGMEEKIEHLAEHVFRFSMGGIKETMAFYKKK